MLMIDATPLAAQLAKIDAASEIITPSAKGARPDNSIAAQKVWEVEVDSLIECVREAIASDGSGSSQAPGVALIDAAPLIEVLARHDAAKENIAVTEEAYDDDEATEDDVDAAESAWEDELENMIECVRQVTKAAAQA